MDSGKYITLCQKLIADYVNARLDDYYLTKNIAKLGQEE